MTGLSIWKILVILGIIVLIFGTRMLRNLGGVQRHVDNGTDNSAPSESQQDNERKS